MKEAKCYSDLIDVAENNMLDDIVLENFTNNTSIASANDKNLLWVGVAGQWQMSDHFLIPIHPATSAVVQW